MSGPWHDEDGYCEICGNGHWKQHMPGCWVADLLDRIALLERAVWDDGDPWAYDGGDPPDEYCFFCGKEKRFLRSDCHWHPVAEHEPGCLWLGLWEASGEEGPEYGPPVPPKPPEPGSIGYMLQEAYRPILKQRRERELRSLDMFDAMFKASKEDKLTTFMFEPGDDQ